MDRRSFLKLFAAAGPVAAVAPTYFFAPVGGWKSDVIVNPRVIDLRLTRPFPDPVPWPEWDAYMESVTSNDIVLQKLLLQKLARDRALVQEMLRFA